MKKIAVFFFIVIIVVVAVSYMYLNYKIDYNNAKKENMQFESYYEQEIYGADLATIINKAIDNNINNNIQKDKKGMYINNNQNSIKVEIKMLDNDNIYQIETIYAGGIEKFVQYYNQIKFKCTKIEHHVSTKKVSYMLFEQITT